MNCCDLAPWRHSNDSEWIQRIIPRSLALWEQLFSDFSGEGINCILEFSQNWVVDMGDMGNMGDMGAWGEGCVDKKCDPPKKERHRNIGWIMRHKYGRRWSLNLLYWWTSKTNIVFHQSTSRCIAKFKNNWTYHLIFIPIHPYC